MAPEKFIIKTKYAIKEAFISPLHFELKRLILVLYKELNNLRRSQSRPFYLRLKGTVLPRIIDGGI